MEAKRELGVDFRQWLRYVRRWWWLLLLLPSLAGVAAYTVGSRQERLYAATATLLINPAVSSGTNELIAINAGQQLALTYQQLVVTEPVLQPVIDQLGLPYGVDVLKKKVRATASQDTQLLRISVSDTDPKAAAVIANTISERFASFITAQTTASNSPSRATLQKLISDTQQQLDTTRNRIAGLEASKNLDAANQSELESLRARASQLESSLGDLLLQGQQMDIATANAQSRIVPSVPATPPNQPYAPRVLFYTLVAVLVGALIAGGTVGAIEYLDNSVRSGDELASLTGAPALSTIASAGKVQPGGRQVYVLSDSKSPSAEAIRLLRANLEFAAAAKSITSLAISSAGPGEGKSTVTANLAVVMAQAGFETVVIDTDLRKPTQHKIFGIANERGVTTLLSHPHEDWQTVAVRVAVPRLLLIPSGPLPPNPADLLSLDRFDDLLRQIVTAADVVLLDTSPVLAVSDPLVIATKTSGALLICRAGQTRREALRRAAAALDQAGVRLVGTVLNQQKSRDEEGYYYYGYYGDTTKKDEPTPRPILR